jgi:hypothetical protein
VNHARCARGVEREPADEERLVRAGEARGVARVEILDSPSLFAHQEVRQRALHLVEHAARNRLVLEGVLERDACERALHDQTGRDRDPECQQQQCDAKPRHD